VYDTAKWAVGGVDIAQGLITNASNYSALDEQQ
jgi:hypothetical protein